MNTHGHFPSGLGGRTILRLGLHFRHCDLGSPCSSSQSPTALKAGKSDGSQRVQAVSGTPCSWHQSSYDPATTLAACPSPGSRAAVDAASVFLSGLPVCAVSLEQPAA